MKKKPSRAARKTQGAAMPPWMPESLVSAVKPTGERGGRKQGKPAGHGGRQQHAPGSQPKVDRAQRDAGGPKTPWSRGTPVAEPLPQPLSRGDRGPESHPPSSRHDPHAAREAGRYENPIPSREAILALLTDATGPQPVEHIANGLAISDDERLAALDKRLAAMLRDGQLIVNRRGGYAVARKLDLVPGTVIANPEGFGFLRPEGGGDDLFLAPNEMRKVLHGDRVLASVTGVDRRGRREGAIVEVLERRLSRVMGRFSRRSGIGCVVPDDRRVLQDILVPPDAEAGARDGQLVVCEIVPREEGSTAPVRQLFGRVLIVLGDKLVASQVVEAAIHAHGIPHEFPQAVIEEAETIPLVVDAKTAAARTDIRDLPLVTIDGEDAKDFDDAVWCEPNRAGFRLVVAIADVSSYVSPGTPLDDEAQLRGTSVYFPGFVVPMLPETLSNGICSLKSKVDRLCFVCDMQVDRSGEVTHSEFYQAVMRSHARLTYTQVWNAIGDGIPDEARANALAHVGALLPQVERLHQLYRILDKARTKRGAIEFETSETRFVIGAQGEVVQAGMLVRNDAHKLIEECMIAANVQAAQFLHERRIPAPYRVHERPPENKYADLLEFLMEFKLSLPPWSKVEPRDFTTLLKKIRERPDAALLESVLLRSQALAVYSTDNHGHFGLALAAYAHFTSPIRRYPDLLVHRAIKHALAGGTADTFEYSNHAMEHLSLESSEKSRRADEASREVDERYRAAWMEQHVGSTFDGVISGVTSFGLFVELAESKVNGLIHVTQLPNDFYHFDPIRKTLTGERRGVAYRLGDPARVLVLRASLEDRKIDFRLADGGAAPAAETSSSSFPQKRESLLNTMSSEKQGQSDSRLRGNDGRGPAGSRKPSNPGKPKGRRR